MSKLVNKEEQGMLTHQSINELTIKLIRDLFLKLISQSTDYRLVCFVKGTFQGQYVGK